MRFPLLALSLLPSALGAVYQRWAAFEEPAKGYDTSLRVSVDGIDSSVLIYRVKDGEHTNIPFGITQEGLQQETGDFTICSQKRSSMGLCDENEVGKFTVKTDGDLEDQILNVHLEGGNTANYEVQNAGLFCVVVYQEGVAEVQDITLVENHWYGKISLSKWESLKIITAIAILISVSQVALGIEFRDARKRCIGTLLDDVKFIFSMKAASLMGKSLSLLFESSISDSSTRLWFDPLFFFDSQFNAAALYIFYKLSVGVFGLTKEQVMSLGMEKKFKIMLRLYAATSFVISFAPLLLRAPFLSWLVVISSLIFSIIWIPMVVIMWKNAKATEREILDPVFARNYALTRKCSLWMPILLWLTKLVGQTAIQSRGVNGTPAGDPFSGMQTIFTQALEIGLSQNFWFVLLKHLPEFSMLVVQWAIIIIWRPRMLERTEDIHSNQLSDAPHAALKLNDDTEPKLPPPEY